MGCSDNISVRPGGAMRLMLRLMLEYIYSRADEDANRAVRYFEQLVSFPKYVDHCRNYTSILLCIDTNDAV